MRSNIGARGFEPPTSWSQTTRSTKLSYAPSSGVILYHEQRLPASGNSVTLGRKLGMKRYGLIISATLVGVTVMLHGQDAAPPSVDLYEGQNQLEPTPSPEPPNGPELPEISQLDQNFSKPRSLGKAADEARVHVEWRQLRNRTVNDPAVQAAKAYAQAARTDLEKRNRLRDYYNTYYERMSTLATTPEIKLALQALRTSHQSLLDQPRVRPSPTPEGFTPTPTPSGTPAKKKPAQKHKKKGKGQKWF
jgi:hypothetical protein